MRRFRLHHLALGGAAVAMVIGAVMLIGRGLREHDIIIASPSPPSIFVDGRLPLEPNDQACLSPVRFTPASGRLRLVVKTNANPVPALRITGRTPELTKTTIVDDYPSGAVNAIIVPFHVSKTTSGSVCLRNTGRGEVALAASNEPRYFTLTNTTLNGKLAPSGMRASLQLLAPDRSTIFERIPTAVRQDAPLTGVLPPLLVWLLLVAVLVAVIGGPLYVMTDVLRSEDESSG